MFFLSGNAEQSLLTGELLPGLSQGGGASPRKTHDTSSDLTLLRANSNSQEHFTKIRWNCKGPVKDEEGDDLKQFVKR